MEKRYALSSGNRIKRTLHSNNVIRIGVSAMSLVWPLMLASLTIANAVAQDASPSQVVVPTDRTVLPIPEPQYPHSTVFDAREAALKKALSD